MKYNVLVIDDDKPMHLIAKNLLREEFNTVHANNVQQAIDILSERKINLILSDIHMPGVSGLELLESIQSDERKNKIPILIMTNLPTVEKEKKALDLGASDFIKKEKFNDEPEEILEIVRMKIVTDIEVSDLGEELSRKKDQLVMKLMEKALDGSFEETASTLCGELHNILDAEFIAFWSIDEQNLNSVCHLGKLDFGDIKDDVSYENIETLKDAYMTNHVMSDEFGFFKKRSEEEGLPAEIGVPIFAVNERDLLMNNREVPDDAPLFGLLVVKRGVLFSTAEFELVKRLSTQSGSILYRLFKK